MNALISYDWLKQYVKLRETPDAFAQRVSLSGPAVEKLIPQDGAFENIVLGRIRDIQAHPKADLLRIAHVDVGDRLLKIVCGGSNIAVGQWVAVALVGARVRWHGAGDLVELQPAEIRGVPSEGMICAANEIGLGAAFPHAEREILDVGYVLGWGKTVSAKAGTPLATILGLTGDVVMDIEVTSNRVDAMGVVGMAREAAAILKRPFVWKPTALPKKRPGQKEGIKVSVIAKKACPRYMAVRMDGVHVGPSPWWLKRRLLSAGLTPINNIVDITNFVMLELAQPLHAFDAAALHQRIEVRFARSGERIKLLNNQDCVLEDSALVIADAERPVALAGIMGGQETAISSETTCVIIEAATFDPVLIRRTARKANLQSDAQLRFEKGLSAEAPPFALARAIELVRDIAGGEVIGSVVDARAGSSKSLQFTFSADEAAALIGVKLPQREIIDVLKRLGFQIKTKGKTLSAVVPWWRDHDIEMGRDFVEEIARVYGYANIPPEIPFGLASRSPEQELIWEDRVRDTAKAAGFTETYSYSFVAPELVRKAGYAPEAMIQLQNPLTADMAVMRTTLLPSLLQIAADNRERYSVQRLFEVANVYYPEQEKKDGLPDEQLELGMLCMGMPQSWKVAKGFVEVLLEEMGVCDVTWRRLDTDPFWHPGRTAQAFMGEHLLATVGEISPQISERFKFDERVAMVDMPLEKLIPFASAQKRYQPLSPYPIAKRDIALVVHERVEYEDIARTVAETDPLIASVEWFDTYRGANLPPEKKSIAVHIAFCSPERTLESAEVDGLMEKIVLRLKEVFKADVRR